ncbi:class I SAM-dependent methyltransferase [Limimonas halophila]|nr:class I SAM-dependent methyltransferase [Limimonas halophila]
MATITGVPTHCNVLLESQREALESPTGTLELVACGDCGHVFNRAFDARRMTYEGVYENSLHWSPRFQDYATRLAERLIADCDLRGKDVLEVGCGRGDFLQEICKAGANTGLGFDPSAPLADDPGATDRVTFVRDYFSPESYPRSRGDLVICQHVLEHVDDPAAFVDLLADALKTPRSCLYIEVPNGLVTVRHGAIWDLIYEHVWYFCERSLRMLLARRGLSTYWVEATFGGQFLSALVGPAEDAAPGLVRGEAPTRADVAAFQGHLDRMIASWRESLELASASGTVVVWGAGSKSVTFLNLTRPESRSIRAVVDVNPHKQGKYIPESGHEIVAPDQLQRLDPDVVLVMNPLYLDEVRRTLADLDLHPQVRSVVS